MQSSILHLPGRLLPSCYLSLCLSVLISSIYEAACSHCSEHSLYLALPTCLSIRFIHGRAAFLSLLVPSPGLPVRAAVHMPVWSVPLFSVDPICSQMTGGYIGIKTLWGGTPPLSQSMTVPCKRHMLSACTHNY